MIRTEKVDFIKGVLSGDKSTLDRQKQLRIESMSKDELNARIEEMESELTYLDIDFSKLRTDEKIDLMELFIKYEAGFVRDLDNKPLQPAEKQFINSIKENYPKII